MPEGSWPAAVVVVEPLAHLRLGHFPKSFADLADGFVEAGVHVEVLTTAGWVFSDESKPRWRVNRYGPLALRIHAAAGTVSGRGRGDYRVLRRAGSVLRTVTMVQQARRVARRSPVQPAAVVVVSGEVNAPFVPLVSGRHKFIVHQYEPDAGSFNRRVALGAQRLRALLRRPAPNVTLAVPDPLWIPMMERFHPGIPAESILVGGSRSVVSGRDEAREALGINSDRRVALLFGAGHPEHDPATVFEALRARSDWLLIIAGETARKFDERNIDQWRTHPVVMGGYVDPSVREALYQAADVVLLSFVPDYRRKSGTLLDAVSHGRGVVVSDRSLAAEQVAEWGMGEVFAAGSPESLSGALDRIDIDASHHAAVAAQAHTSNKAVAIQHLDAFARMAPLRR